MQWLQKTCHFNAKVDVNCERKDGMKDGRKTGHLYRTLFKQVRRKKYMLSTMEAPAWNSLINYWGLVGSVNQFALSSSVYED